MAETLELAGNAARDNKRSAECCGLAARARGLWCLALRARSRITPRAITLAVRNDEELGKCRARSTGLQDQDYCKEDAARLDRALPPFRAAVPAFVVIC